MLRLKGEGGVGVGRNFNKQQTISQEIFQELKKIVQTSLFMYFRKRQYQRFYTLSSPKTSMLTDLKMAMKT